MEKLDIINEQFYNNLYTKLDKPLQEHHFSFPYEQLKNQLWNQLDNQLDTQLYNEIYWPLDIQLGRLIVKFNG